MTIDISKEELCKKPAIKTPVKQQPLKPPQKNKQESIFTMIYQKTKHRKNLKTLAKLAAHPPKKERSSDDSSSEDVRRKAPFKSILENRAKSNQNKKECLEDSYED